MTFEDNFIKFLTSAPSLPHVCPAQDYVLSVCTLLDACCRRLALIGPRDNALSDLALYLATTERQIHEYIIGLLADAGEEAKPFVDDSTIMVTAARLSTVKDALNRDWKNSSSHRAGGVNSLLFYLINTLQLCLQRIEDADKILCGKKAARQRSKSFSDTMGLVDAASTMPRESKYEAFLVLGNEAAQSLARRQQLTHRVFRWTRRVAMSVGVGGLMYIAMDKTQDIGSAGNRNRIAATATKIVGAVFMKSLANRRYEVWRLHHRLEDSTQSLSMWQQKWIIVSSVLQQNNLRKAVSYNKLIAEPSAEDHNVDMKASSRRLLEALPLRSNKGAFWYSQGALRLLLVRRVMDLVYASVGTAMDLTGGTGGYGMWVPLAGLCASYYAIAGSEVTSTRAAHAVAAPSMDFIKRAWGMVTIPPIKWLSVEASKIMKGVSLIERVFVAGVPCLIISQSPQPGILAAINRVRRQQKRAEGTAGGLSSIVEEGDAVGLGEDMATTDRRRGSVNGIFEEKDVIFHVTGGGWFIHTTATDIPFLAEWSAVSDSVVIIPEYDLLPEHHFPRAINQVTAVYCALMDGTASTGLGFRTRKIAVTGESAGGNLAAALCVKLCLDGIVQEKPSDVSGSDEDLGSSGVVMPKRQPSAEDLATIDSVKAPRRRRDGEVCLPDALMLSCPALNMCHSISPSRVMGTGDPVLPSGLIQMISNEYVPPSLGISKEHPLVSPYHASDEILSRMPRTLLWVSASDPLLDDAVDFNTRLRRVGVNSRIHAAQHMPHAFWGLSNAGFPEALKVQKSCKAFLSNVMAGEY